MVSFGFRFTLLAALGLTVLACAAPADEDASEGTAAQTAGTTSALGFMCECKATGPGVENAKGIKECSYACTCDGLYSDAIRPAGTVSVGPMESQAFSWESWDAGSRICHGQYAWKPTLSSPNWEIKVRFSSFKITHLGYVSYANTDGESAHPDATVTERVETSTNVTETIQRTAVAPEVRDALAKKLGVRIERK